MISQCVIQEISKNTVNSELVESYQVVCDRFTSCFILLVKVVITISCEDSSVLVATRSKMICEYHCEQQI